MKKKLLLSMAMTLALITAIAQCDYPIPPFPGHVEVTSDQAVDAIPGVYWVCENVSLEVTSSAGAAFYLETGASVTFNGSEGDLVAAKTGTTITNNTDQDIGVAGNSSGLTLNNNSSGSITVFAECPEMVFLYTFVDESSCISATSIDEEEAKSLAIYPNPAMSGEDIQIGLQDNYTVMAHNTMGQLVYFRENANGPIPAGTLSSGVYVLTVESNFNMYKQRVVIK